jgi:hypothetical protein
MIRKTMADKPESATINRTKNQQPPTIRISEVAVWSANIQP